MLWLVIIAVGLVLLGLRGLRNGAADGVALVPSLMCLAFAASIVAYLWSYHGVAPKCNVEAEAPVSVSSPVSK